MITLSEKRAINKMARLTDESHKWPICSRFNATERAIRRAREYSRLSSEFSSSYEYWLFLDQTISEIVNNNEVREKRKQWK
jgi:hypothetical protein